MGGGVGIDIARLMVQELVCFAGKEERERERGSLMRKGKRQSRRFGWRFFLFLFCLGDCIMVRGRFSGRLIPRRSQGSTSATPGEGFWLMQL